VLASNLKENTHGWGDQIKKN